MEANIQHEMVVRIVNYVAEYAEKAKNPFLDITKAKENLVPITFSYKNEFIDKMEGFYKFIGSTDEEARRQAVYRNCGGTVAINFSQKEITLCLDETNPSLFHLINPVSHEIYHNLITTSTNLYRSLKYNKNNVSIGKRAITTFAWQFLDEGLVEWVSNEIEERFKKENDCEKYKMIQPGSFEPLAEKYVAYKEEYWKNIQNQQFKKNEDSKMETYIRGLDVCRKIGEKFGKDVVPFSIIAVLNHFSIYNSVDEKLAAEYESIERLEDRRLFRNQKRFEAEPVKTILELANMEVPEYYETGNTDQIREILTDILSAKST